MRALKSMQELKVQEYVKRSGQKKFQREQQRELKNLFDKTHHQETAYRKTDELKQTLFEHRERSERIVEAMEERHLKQIKQFTAAEERKITDQRILMELQVYSHVRAITSSLEGPSLVRGPKGRVNEGILLQNESSKECGQAPTRSD